MSETSTDVRVEVTVDAPIAKAFDVFTQQIDSWWPREYRLGAAERINVQIEPRLDGRWFEQTSDGNEAEWGRVLAWAAPNHIVLSWSIAVDFSAQPDPERASRVDVTFTEVDSTRTTVTVVHSDFERHGEGWQGMREGVAHQGGWPGIMDAYAKLAAS